MQFIKSLILSVVCITTCFASTSILENDEIIKIHKKMGMILKEEYKIMPKNFDMFNNLCTATVQFVYKQGEDIKLTEGEHILKDGRPIISSSSYTQDIYCENSTEISEIISWPFKDNGQLRSIDDKNNFKQGNVPTKIYNKLFGGINDHKKCSSALDITVDEYENLLKNNNKLINPIFYIQTNYFKQYGNLEFEDLKHSELLLVWWIELHIEDLKSQCLEKLTSVSMIDDQDNIEILYPIIHFHTRRQTCPDCEKLIQKSAKKCGYVPIISFSSLYLTEKNIINSIPCKSSLNGKEERIMPFSTLKNNFLDMDMLEKLKNFKVPRMKDYYLSKKYPAYTEILNKEFEEKTIKDLKTIEKYCQERGKIKGVKRFPIQFYTSF
jgi:hypothetical protein